MRVSTYLLVEAKVFKRVGSVRALRVSRVVSIRLALPVTTSPYPSLLRHQLRHVQGAETPVAEDPAGDGFFAAFDGPARGVRAAAAIRDALPSLGVEIRAGLHTGECEKSDGKIAGIAVSTGARISSLAAPGEVLVSSTVKDLVAGSVIVVRGSRRAPAQGHPGRAAPVCGCSLTTRRVR